MWYLSSDELLSKLLCDKLTGLITSYDSDSVLSNDSLDNITLCVGQLDLYLRIEVIPHNPKKD